VPIYEYRCESCDHRQEKLQKMSEGDLVDCPECDRPHLKRLVSAAGFRLKGSGWYETDFKKDNKRNLADSPSKGDGGSDKSSSTSSSAASSSSDSSVKKTESKPVTKTASKE
jgi:putative FmdB family regulatory protein